MIHLLDTCILSLFARGNPAVLGRIKASNPDDIAVSSVTLMEIEYGLALNPSRARKLRPVLEAFFASVHLVSYAREDARATAAVRAALRAAGTPIGPYDVMLAGCALARGLTFVTANTGEFARVSGLALEDWSG
ncbi:MAG: type II toxin-antitoxin system VapC family toxin [Chromatiaceae bacterium]